MRDELVRALLRGQGSAWGGLALMGGAQEVLDLQRDLLAALDREWVKVFLLGGCQDRFLLQSFEVLELNPVRTEGRRCARPLFGRRWRTCGSSAGRCPRC